MRTDRVNDRNRARVRASHKEPLIVEVNNPEELRRESDARLLSLIRRITDDGSDAMVKQKKDGSLVAYEIKMNKITD